MSKQENPFFGLDETYYAGGTIPSVEADLEGVNLEGREYIFEDPAGTGQLLVGRIVRNRSGFELAPKRLVQLSADGKSAEGYARTSGADRVFPVSDQLSRNVPDDDLFFVVTKGPCLVKTPLEGDGTNVIALGARLVALTAATSGATTAGRPIAASYAGATAPLAAQINGYVGMAISAATTANTNSDILVNVRY